MRSSSADKLKIAIIHLSFIYSGGGEKLVLEEAKLLRKRGHEVTIYTPLVDRKNCFPDQINDVDIREFIPSVFSFIKRHGSFFVLINCVLAPILSFRLRGYDVVFAANQPSLWFAYFSKKFFGIPYVSYLAQPTRFLYPRDIDSETGLHFSNQSKIAISTKLMKLFRRFIKFSDHLSVSNSDEILVNGKHVKDNIDRIYKVNSTLCPAGTYQDKLPRPLNKRTQRPYLLITNRHFPQKRFEYAITSFANLKDEFPKLQLIITGEATEYTLEVVSLIERLDLDGVHFVGYVNQNKLKKLYTESLVYLYTAPEEDFGMGIIEAMGYGTPVVAWNSAGPSKIIKNGYNGLLADPYSVSDFSEKIREVLTNKKLFAALSKNSYNTIRESYRYDKHIDRIEGSLRKVLKVRSFALRHFESNREIS